MYISGPTLPNIRVTGRVAVDSVLVLGRGRIRWYCFAYVQVKVGGGRWQSCVAVIFFFLSVKQVCCVDASMFLCEFTKN